MQLDVSEDRVILGDVKNVNGAYKTAMNYLIWGVTGQARVLRPILDAGQNQLCLLIDNNKTTLSPFPDYQDVIEGHTITQAACNQHGAEAFIVAIGGSRGRDRTSISSRLIEYGLLPLEARHETAWMANSARAGDGCQILARACVSENVEIGSFSIINTAAIVDHDSMIGTGVHIMPGATIAGEVVIESFSTIGSNATILPRIKIGSGAIVGAGAVVTKDVAPNSLVVGNPARIQVVAIL